MHLQHGPIDLVIMAEERSEEATRIAFRAARDRFLSVLDEFSLADLVDDNPALRRAAGLAPRLGCACPTALDIAEAEKAMVYEFA